MDKTAQQHQKHACMPPRVQLDHHDSVRSHVRHKVSIEVERLERRVEMLRHTKAPHIPGMISAYERMIERKKGFLQNWALEEPRFY